MGKLLSGNGYDLDEHIPYYLQLKSVLEEKIENQELRSGDQLPSESEICEEFGVSRTVVRQALHEMVLDGLVLKKKGKGSFVSEPKLLESFVQKLSGFHEDMATQQRETHARVLSSMVTKATVRIARLLQLRAGSKVILLQRLRYVEADPIQLVTSYLPYKLCAEVLTADFSRQSLYRFLEDHGIFLTRGYRTIEAVRASDAEVELMNIEQGTPMIRIESIGYMDDGTPVEYYEAVHRGDRTRFRVELVRERVREQKKRTPESGEPLVGLSGIEVLPARKHGPAKKVRNTPSVKSRSLKPPRPINGAKKKNG